jgi:hypothetical protein
MADTEQGDLGGDTQVTETSDSGSGGDVETTKPEVFDSGSSSGAATDFTQVKPLNEGEDPAHANFLPTEGHDTPDELISDREEGES